MIRQIKVSGIADGAAKLDRFEGIGVVEGNKFGDKIRPLGLEPKMEQQIASVEGAASVHETDKERVDGSVGTQAEFDMRKSIVNSDRHRRKHEARRRSMGGESLHKHQQKAGLLRCGTFRRRRRRDGGSVSRRVSRRGTGRRKFGRSSKGKGVSRRNAKRSGRRQEFMGMRWRFFGDEVCERRDF